MYLHGYSIDVVLRTWLCCSKASNNNNNNSNGSLLAAVATYIGTTDESGIIQTFDCR